MRYKHKALWGESPVFELMAENYPCRIVKSKNIYYPTYAAYPFNNDSPYIEVFSHQINKILEHGLDKEWQEATKQDDVKCEKQTTEFFRTLSYNDVNAAFGMFLLGSFFALLYSVTEFLYKRFYALNNEHSQQDED